MLTRSTCPTDQNLPKFDTGRIMYLYLDQEFDGLDRSGRTGHLTCWQPYTVLNERLLFVRTWFWAWCQCRILLLLLAFTQCSCCEPSIDKLIPVARSSVIIRFVLTTWANGSLWFDQMGQWELLIWSKRNGRWLMNALLWSILCPP